MAERGSGSRHRDHKLSIQLKCSECSVQLPCSECSVQIPCSECSVKKNERMKQSRPVFPECTPALAAHIFFYSAASNQKHFVNRRNFEKSLKTRSKQKIVSNFQKPKNENLDEWANGLVQTSQEKNIEPASYASTTKLAY